MKKYILIILGFCFAFFCSTNVLAFENNVQTNDSPVTSVACSRNSMSSLSGGSKVRSKRRSRRRGAYENRTSKIIGHSIVGIACFSVACVVGLFAGGVTVAYVVPFLV